MIKPSLLLTVFLFAGSLATAAELAPGAALSETVMKDQNDKEQKIDSQAKCLVFARDMDSNKVVTAALESSGGGKLSEKSCFYVADVSGMPSMIMKMFALPKMKKYSYPVLLDHEGKITKDFPFKAKQATLIRLNNLKVDSVQYLANADELKKALDN